MHILHGKQPAGGNLTSKQKGEKDGGLMQEIDPSAIISELSDIEKSVRGSNLTIMAGTFVDSFVKIKFTGGDGHIKIGSNCYLNSGSVLYSGNGITIGNEVLIAANCTIAAAGHNYLDSSKSVRSQGFPDSRGGVIIEDDVWIGANSVILDGSVIRKGAVVGANSLVRGELISNGIYFGSPVVLTGFRE